MCDQQPLSYYSPNINEPTYYFLDSPKKIPDPSEEFPFDWMEYNKNQNQNDRKLNYYQSTKDEPKEFNCELYSQFRDYDNFGKYQIHQSKENESNESSDGISINSDKIDKDDFQFKSRNQNTIKDQKIPKVEMLDRNHISEANENQIQPSIINPDEETKEIHKNIKSSSRSNDSGKSKDSKEYQYLNTRETIRAEKKYYKDDFNQHLKRNKYHRGIKQLPHQTIDDLFTSFCEKFYEESGISQDEVPLDELKDAFKNIILSNRHKKNESFTKNQNFELIRKVTTSFNYNSFTKLFRNKVYVVIFKNFYNKTINQSSKLSSKLEACLQLINNISEGNIESPTNQDFS